MRLRLELVLASLLSFAAVASAAGTTYTYYGNAYSTCGGTYCTGGPYALSIEFTTTLTGNALASLPFTDITSTITSFRFTDESGLTIDKNNALYKQFSISTNASGNLVAWLIEGCGGSCNIQMQTNWKSPSGFAPGADFSETTASFAGSYGFIGNDPGAWSASTGLTTYLYHGNHFTSFSSPYTGSDSITGFFTTYSLPGNLTGANVTSNILNFSFTDGVNTLTPGNTGFPIPIGATGGPRFVISTDLQGKIRSWDVTLIEAVAPPNNYALFTCNDISTYFNSCPTNPYDLSYEGNGTIEGMVSSDPGTWSAAVVVGMPADSGVGSCVPFGCNGPNDEYQQVYMNSLFSGPITITGLEFFNTQFNSGAHEESAIDTGTFTVSLSTTSASWDTLSSTPANNIGGNNTEVFNGSLAQPWAFGDTLSITFSTPFTYVPGPSANLLLDIVVTGLGNSGGPGEIFFDTNGYNNGGFNGNTIFGRLSKGGFFPEFINSGYGLVTGFTVSELVGKAISSTKLTSSPGPFVYGLPVTFTAKLTSSAGPPPNGETVTFKKGTTELGTGTLSGGAARFTTSKLPEGTNSITATYGGDADFTSSSSALTISVVQPPSIKVSGSAPVDFFPNPQYWTVTITNKGPGTAYNVRLASATVNGVGGSESPSGDVGNLAAGKSVTIKVTGGGELLPPGFENVESDTVTWTGGTSTFSLRFVTGAGP